MMKRRDFLRVSASGLIAAPFISTRAWAAYPDKQIHWIVPYPPGGTTDILARLVAQFLSDRLGQQFVIENRAGGGNNIGTDAVVRAAPDGYTVLLVNPANGINTSLYKKLPFNFVTDIAPMAGITRVPNVMEINPNVPAKTVAEFIAYAKANPGKINMASSGNGTSVHLSGELFMAMTGVKMTHVPYKGAGPALIDMLSNQCQVFFDNLPSSIEHIRAGKLRALAVTTDVRSPALPDVPTVADTVKGYEASAWFGMGAPKGTPPEVIAVMNKAMNDALADPKLIARLADLGGVPMKGTPEDFGKVIVSETEKWRKVVEFSGASVE
ncbi:Bug family tripartite tricarboxylate transporter substrate binding protein [Rhodoplanes sp. Z2-YC6860]|uniref:Bug family tripartite tricarboxylate transporter substrate binding protein n=1 Tax=Rhodoplanes sp. Z2-YC6860 TaxID=674703 RepID=UPI00078BA2E3|nr:tripartite tricarboxylate transporter substrate binding protein [Rhodoplanes sp. Z2-YC6860]AMN41027.1 DHA2 family major facilitator superfamily protein [Rhodoplanes sp. Z2-YC6860]